MKRTSLPLLKRRDFIAGLAGAVACPLATQAQQPERVRRIGVLMSDAVDDPQSRVRVAAFVESLGRLRWTDGHNVRIDTRWGTGDADRVRKYAVDLVALARPASGRCRLMSPMRWSQTL